MPSNPERKERGGDVDGEKPIDVSQGEALRVASASFDPGYDISNSLQETTKADLVTGFCSYGKSIGESDGKRGRNS